MKFHMLCVELQESEISFESARDHVAYGREMAHKEPLRVGSMEEAEQELTAAQARFEAAKASMRAALA
jgi:hypothetical protein